MNGYDWDFGFGFGRRYSAHPGGGGYGREYRRGYDRPYRGGGQRGSPQGRWSQGRRGGGGGGGGGGYDLGLYGERHPTFGGYPGGRQQGMYYGGGYEPQRRGGMAGGFGRGGERGSWERGGWGGGGGGYDRGYARQPYLPEAAYRRHPELDQPPGRRPGDRWPDQGHPAAAPAQAGDDEIRQAVRENLYQDTWVDADRLEVSVEEGVVTLRGEVDDYLEARYAWDDAWEVEGVRGVINQITVRTDLPAAEGHGQTVLQTGGGEGGAGGEAQP